MAYLYRRGKHYWVGYKLHGRSIRKSLKVTSREKAKLLFSEYQVLESRESNQSAILTVKRNLDDVIVEFLERDKVGKSHHTLREKEGALGRFSAYLDGGIPRIDGITTSIINDYFHKRLNESIAGANKDLKVIKGFLNYSVKMGCLRHNPAASIKKVKTVKKIFRDLSFEEVGVLLNTAQKNFPHLYPLVAASYYLGLREKELSYLEWRDVDLGKNIVYVRTKAENRVKDCEERAIPLNTKLREILLALPRQDRFIFLTRSGVPWRNNLYREFQKIVAGAGLQDVSLQTMRETFGSHLLRRGVSIYLVSKYLGHSSVDVTTRHYAHIPIEMTHDAVNVL